MIADSGEFALRGILTVPNGKGPFPAVVLVHGSGPHDRDGTIGLNKPFRDVAWRLASKGTAVLRYEERTLAHGDKLASIMNFTVKEEVIDDALEAVALLRKLEVLAANRIFVLGHSLGGMLVPSFAAAGKKNQGVYHFSQSYASGLRYDW